MRVLDCPQCGAPVNFRSSTTVFAVCEHCRTMVVIRGKDVESLGVAADLMADLTPFQLGVRGEWKGQAFEIVGRVRIGWEQGSWNEWCIMTAGGSQLGWMAEAQGFLMMSFEKILPEPVPADAGHYTQDATLELAGRQWSVDGVKRCVCLGAEGELPFAALPRTSRISVDLSDASGGFANIELSEKTPAFYSGEFVRFEELHLQGLRPVPGWDGQVIQEKNQTTALACPSCGSVIELRAAGQSMSAVCGSCHSVIDTATPELVLIEKAEQVARRVHPLIPLGQRGRLNGVEYDVIGYLERSDEGARWAEYLLFNPWHGFTWLVFFDGHWNFVTRLTHVNDRERGQHLSFEGRDYKLFASGKARVVDVIGEFYWKASRGELANVFDYVSPPFILSKEVYPQLTEVAWSLGQYMDRKVVGEAFGVKDLPPAAGIYSNQPNPYAGSWASIRRQLVCAGIALICIQWIYSVSSPEREVNSTGFVFHRHPPVTAQVSSTTAEPPEILSTPHFQVNGGGRLVVEAQAGVDNSWLDLNLELVNAVTKETAYADLEVSYYYGYDSEQWSEGGTTATVSFPAVSPGEYFITVDPDADAKISTLPFLLRTRHGGLFISNFFASLALILLYPAYLYIRNGRFEQARWAESDIVFSGSHER